jgi:hypothetical protein
MQLHIQPVREVRMYQVIIGLLICQVVTVVPFFLWQSYPAKLLEMLP